VPLPPDIALPLPMGYDDKQTGLEKLLPLVKEQIVGHMQREVLPHVSGAWVDYQKTKVGYEIPLTRQFYVYQAPRPLGMIESDINRLEEEILQMLEEVL
jgi:type I restriction enzyme M protein